MWIKSWLINVQTWDHKFELPHESCIHISNIQDHFECIIETHEKFAGNSPIKIYVNKIQIRITFKIESGYCLEILTPEIMKLLKSPQKNKNKD